MKETLSKTEITLIRKKVIEAICFQFKSGIEFESMGTLPPETMINLIANYKENGEATT